MPQINLGWELRTQELCLVTVGRIQIVYYLVENLASSVSCMLVRRGGFMCGSSERA